MHWYGGSVAEAVSLSKQRNAIFVVFVEGDDELSTEMTTTLDDSAVVKRLSDESNFLTIKLKSGSVNYTHFARIYQFVPVPSLFFIGRNGTPLEVVCAGVQANKLATRIDRILEEHHKENQSTVQPSTSSQNLKEQTASLLQAETTANAPVATNSKPIQLTQDVEPESSSGPAAKIPKTEHHEVTKSGKEYEVVCDGDVCVRRPITKPDEPGPSQRGNTPTTSEQKAPETETAATSESTADMEDKLERAKTLIEARRKEKAEKEKELEKQKELERRMTGQGVAELKRWQAEQELKQIQEERKREKLENSLARQRILEQIAQDRAERRAREAPPVQPPRTDQQPQQATATSGDGSTRARIQFKLPDGSSHTAHFEADRTLADLRTYVADNLQMSASSFSLWIAFPRRELTENDATLTSLQLAPSAALLVLPRRTAAVVARPSTISTIITFITQLFTSLILEPSQQLYTWIRVRLFPPPNAPRSPSPAARAPPNAPTLRRRGNIHRLPDDRTRDDDNNTWNGNSTQQM